MKYRRLGNTGLKVSEVGIGCNNFGDRLDVNTSARVVHSALDAGINFFDTADIYSFGQSEEFLGKALRDRREKALIASKFGFPMGDSVGQRGASRHYIYRAVEASLLRLGTDYIDLYQLHCPDPDTPIEETLEALDGLVRQGKLRYVGCSNVNGWQIADADWTARSNQLHRFETVQNAYSLLDRRADLEVLPACARFKLGFLPYFPLASGVLTGKYKRDQERPAGSRLTRGLSWAEGFVSEDNLIKVEKLSEFAELRSHSLIELAFGWLLSNPLIPSVIAGAMSPEQVASNTAAAGWELSAEERGAIDEIVAPGGT